MRQMKWQPVPPPRTEWWRLEKRARQDVRDLLDEGFDAELHALMGIPQEDEKAICA